jgi:hypothetical protein
VAPVTGGPLDGIGHGGARRRKHVALSDGARRSGRGLDRFAMSILLRGAWMLRGMEMMNEGIRDELSGTSGRLHKDGSSRTCLDAAPLLLVSIDFQG